jgi:hypothetical protein
MSESFFRIERGLELDEIVQYLQGAGAPGAAGDTSLAEVGSVYTDNATGAMYTKISAGVGTDKWQKLASETYVNNALGATVSWREPAFVRDNVATVLPTGVAASPIVVDGVSISNGGRVLFSALTGGDGKNVYVYDQATGLFVEDINQESSGDAAFVQSGTSAGKTYIYNGSTWVQSDQSSLDELGFIRTFIGKGAAGSETPTYSSTNFVTNATSLEDAIGALDAEVGANVSLGNYIVPANKVNANIQALDTAIGANVTAGNHISPANKVQQNIQELDTQVGAELAVGNFIAAAQSTNSAITALDAEIGANVVNGNFILAASKVNANIQAIDAEIGANVINGTYILAANKINANIQALDTAVANNSQQVAVTNVTSVQTIDSITAGAAKWLVRVEDAADSTRVYATEVYALGNGVSADYTKYATLKIGTNITGLEVTVDFNAGSLRLRVASTAAVNVVARRVGVVV